MLAAAHNIMRAREDGGKERQRQNRRMRRSAQREREAEGDRRVQVRDVMVHSSRDRRYPGQWCTYIHIHIYVYIYLYIHIYASLCMIRFDTYVHVYACATPTYLGICVCMCHVKCTRARTVLLVRLALICSFLASASYSRIPGFPFLRRVSDKSVAETSSA